MAAIPVQVGQTVDNKFRIDRVLAQGGMGVLVVATHLHLDQKVTVKFRSAGRKVDAKRFIREAQLAVQLQNRHVCRVMDLGFLDEDTPYIVMEYLDGKDLAREVEDNGRLSIEDAVEYLLQTCDAMVEAHALGIVHRDLKPENLFLARQHDGRSIVKVLDFGISKQHGVAMTTDSDLMGTPAYMAHEQWASAKHVTAATDIYALGATLHFLLAGVPPFEAASIPEMFAKISTQTPPPLRTLRADVPREIEDLVLSCLARSPAQRPSDVLAVSDALLPFAPGRKRAALSVVGRATFGNTARPRRWRVAIAAPIALVAVTGIVVAVASTRGGSPPSREPAKPAPEPTIVSAPDALVTKPAEATEPDANVASPTAMPPDARGRAPDAQLRVTPDAAVPMIPVDAPAPVPSPPDACDVRDTRCNFGT